MPLLRKQAPVESDAGLRDLRRAGAWWGRRAAVAAFLGALLLSAPALAQREWRKSDGPYKGLTCAPNETVVTIVDGVRCQELPRCGPGERLDQGADGLRCKSDRTFTKEDTSPRPSAAESAAGSDRQRYLAHEWNYAFAEVPTVDGAGQRVTDPKTGEPGTDGICVVWRVGWPIFVPYVAFEHKQMTRWYTGWGYQVDPRRGRVKLGGFAAPMVKETAQGRRRVGPDETVPELTMSAPLATTPPAGCTKKWIDAWAEQNAGAEAPSGGIEGASGSVPSLGLEVGTLRFFEGPRTDLPPPEKRPYDDLFFYNAARYVYWELKADHAPVDKPVPFTVTEVWRSAGGIAFRAEHKHTLTPGARGLEIVWGARLPATKSVTIDNSLYQDCVDNYHRGWREGRRPDFNCDPNTSVQIEFWPEGTYQVDLYIDNVYAAAGRFRMGRKEAIYAEAERKIRDARAPTQRVTAPAARVVSVRFFDANRSFRDRFQQGSGEIGWELELAHDPPGQWDPLVLEALLTRESDARGTVMQRRVLGSAIPATLAASRHADRFGWSSDYYFYRTGTTSKSPGAWLPGQYRVDLFAGGDKIATGRFRVD